MRRLCDQKGVEIIEANVCKDHIHTLVSIPAKLSVSQFMGYYVDTVGRNKKVIEEYIKNQIQEDLAYE